MESDFEIRRDLRLKHGEQKPPRKKSFWQKIKEFFTQEPEGQGSENWRNRDPESW